jgi:hypothetical protein
MHGMVKRAAAVAIPALLGLAVSPASAMAAPHADRAVAGPVMSSQEVHERLVRLPLSGTIQGRLAGTTDAEFAATPVIPIILIFPPTRGGGPVGGPAKGIIAYGNNDKIVGNHVLVSAGSGISGNSPIAMDTGAGNFLKNMPTQLGQLGAPSLNDGFAP